MHELNLSHLRKVCFESILIIAFTANFFLSGFAKSDLPHNSEVVVTIFISFHCPISQKYVPVLNNVYASYSRQQHFRVDIVNPNSTERKMKKDFIREFDVKFPVTFDTRSRFLTQQLSATTTPEVIVKKGENVLYRGAIDNWFYELGKYRAAATEHYLVDALQAVAKNETPSVRETKPIGCLIPTQR